MAEDRSMGAHRPRTTLALHNETLDLYGISHELDLDKMLFMREHLQMPSKEIMEYRDSLSFQIQGVSSRISLSTMSRQNFGSFKAIDAMPELVQTEQYDMKTTIFKTVSKTKEIYVGPETAQEAMDLVLKLQEPKQEEIRAFRLQEARREKVRKVLSEDKQDECIASIIRIA